MSRLNAWQRRGLAVLMGLAVLAVGAWLLPSPALLWQRASSLPPWTWLLACIGMGMSYALRAARLRDEWIQRMHVAWSDCLHITLLHSAAINVLPFRAGELGYPWLLHRRWGVSLGESAPSLFWLRLQDAAVLGAIGWAVFGPDAGLHPDVAGALRATMAVAVIAVLALFGARIARAVMNRLGDADAVGAEDLAPTKTSTPASTPASTGLVRRSLRRLLVSALRSRLRGWLWTTANWLVKMAVLALLLHQLAALPPMAAWAGALAGEGAAVLPLQPPAGFGTYEAGVWLGARLGGAQVAGDAAQTVLGAAFSAHLFVIVFSLIAALLSQGLNGAVRRVEKTS